MTVSVLWHLLNLFPWIERERVLGKADLQIGMAKFGLSRLVKEHLTIVVAGNRVDDHAVVPWRDHCHAHRRKQYPAESCRS